MTPPAGLPPLSVVGRLDVPADTLLHRFIDEAWAIVKTLDDRLITDPESAVLGTANSGQVELYGWGSDIPAHVDDTGWVYLCGLDTGLSTVNAGDNSAPIQVRLEQGTVVRLYDHVHHWTHDAGPRLALFLGSFPEPCDAKALALLQAGVHALARGDYTAPRVPSGWRTLQHDECLVVDWETQEVTPMLRVQAAERGMDILPCSQCGAPAIQADHHWPYHADRNVCAAHKTD